MKGIPTVPGLVMASVLMTTALLGSGSGVDRGPLASGATVVEEAGNTLPVAANASMTPTETPLGAVSSSAVPEWTPTPQPGLSVVADDRHRSMTWEQYQALQAFPEDQQMLFACIAYHESRWQADAVGDGGRSVGAFQVMEQFHGRVPDTLKEQAKHAAEVFSVNGSGIWTTARLCQ